MKYLILVAIIIIATMFILFRPQKPTKQIKKDIQKLEQEKVDVNVPAAKLK